MHQWIDLLDIIIKNWNVDWSCLPCYPYTREKEDREEWKIHYVYSYTIIVIASLPPHAATVACSTRAVCAGGACLLTASVTLTIMWHEK